MSKRSWKAVNLIPLGDRVLIRTLDPIDVTLAGLHLPPTAQEVPQEGIVLATGKGKYISNGEWTGMGCVPGDRVVFNKYGPTEFDYEGEALVICDTTHILAVLPPLDQPEGAKK